MTRPLRRCDPASPDSSPHARVNRQPPATAIPQINKPAVVADVPITEKPRQQSKSVLGEDLIHKRRLFLDRLCRAAAWESVIIETSIHRFRVEFEDRPQSCPASSVYLIQGLTQDELAAVRSVPNIKNVRHGARPARAVLDDGAGCARVHATDDHVNPVERSLPVKCSARASQPKFQKRFRRFTSTRAL